MIIWAYKKITDLKGQTGFVDCPKELAEKLIADGHVQDPKVGANAFKAIQAGAITNPYEVKEEIKEEVKEEPVKKKRKVSEEEGDK